MADSSPDKLSGGGSDSSMFFPFAPQPDIVRAAQKDEYYKRALYDQYFDLVQDYLGPRTALLVQDEVKLTSDLSYYGLTQLLGRQTLGEEYCDIIEVNGSRVTPLYSKERMVLLFFHVLLPYLSSKLYHRLNRLTRPQFTLRASVSELSDRQKKLLAFVLPRLKEFLDILQRVHLAFFYFSGLFYHVAYRLTSTRYVLNHKLDELRPQYSILGLLIFIQLLVSLGLYIREKVAQRQQKQLQQAAAQASTGETADTQSGGEWGPSEGKCSLCLETRVNPTATSCGHLFCWSCITEWCNNKAECPLDRTPQKMTDLVVVYNI